MMILGEVEAQRISPDIVMMVAADWRAYYLMDGRICSSEQIDALREDLSEDYRVPYGPAPSSVVPFPSTVPAGKIMRLGWADRGAV